MTGSNPPIQDVEDEKLARDVVLFAQCKGPAYVQQRIEIANRLRSLSAENVELRAESADLTKALTGLTCSGSEFFIRKGERYVADIQACVEWVRRSKQDAHRSRADAILDRKKAEARVQELEAAIIPLVNRCETAVKPDDADSSGITVRVEHLRRLAELHPSHAARLSSPVGQENQGLSSARDHDLSAGVKLEGDPGDPCPTCGALPCDWVNNPFETGRLEARPEVVAFAQLMERQLRANDHKPGWKADTALDLFERLGEESAELLSALHRHAKRLSWGDGWVMETDTEERVGREAADVANFAMMIADVSGALVQLPMQQTAASGPGLSSNPSEGTRP